MREYQRKWIARRRAEWFAANGPCARCGSWDDLRLDHVDPRQKVEHKVWSWSTTRRDAELAKCQVLCFPCHVVKTNEDGSHPVGEARSDAKLTAVQVTAIRLRVAAGESKRGLAREFGVDDRLIRLIEQRKVWKHV